MTEHKVVEQKGDEEGTVYVVTMHSVEAPLTLGFGAQVDFPVALVPQVPQFAFFTSC